MVMSASPRRARRWIVYGVAVAAAGGVVGGGLAVRDIAQARSLLRSQRLRIVFEHTRPGGPADLITLPGVRPDSLVTRGGPGERTEVRTYGDVRVTCRFGPAEPKGRVLSIEGAPPAMAWPRGRAPGNLRSGFVVPLAASRGALGS